MALPVLRRNREESTPVAWRAPLGQPWSDFGGAAEGLWTPTTCSNPC